MHACARYSCTFCLRIPPAVVPRKRIIASPLTGAPVVGPSTKTDPETGATTVVWALSHVVMLLQLGRSLFCSLFLSVMSFPL